MTSDRLDEIRLRIAEVLSDGSNAEYQELINHRAEIGIGQFWFAIDRNEQAIALAVLVRDHGVARLAWLLSSQSDLKSPARHLISATVFTEAAQLGV